MDFDCDYEYEYEGGGSDSTPHPQRKFLRKLDSGNKFNSGFINMDTISHNYNKVKFEAMNDLDKYKQL